MARRIRIFDTTLRDGEQAPGCSMNHTEKIELALQLESLGVDILEAGFAAASQGDFEAIRAVSGAVREPVVASLCRALPGDIDRAWEAIQAAAKPRIHTFIATSPIHMQYKLRMTPEAVLEQTAAMVKYARNLCPNIEFSAEDASRSDTEFLCRVFETAIAAGATTINIPDTVGYAVPEEFGALVGSIMNRVPDIDRAVVSVHCHNDLGLAVANSLAAVRAGAGQVECTVNGLGERAGNAALEELVMALGTRTDSYGISTGIRTNEIYRTSRLVSSTTGIKPQPNKAIVGANAFAHEAGIHQHGVLANRQTYEIMTPESIGVPRSEMVLGKHSGKHAFEERLQSLGIRTSTEQVDRAFQAFKELADRKKVVSDRDIEALVLGMAPSRTDLYTLSRFTINAGTGMTATSVVRVNRRDSGWTERVALGDGPIDASFKAIEKITGRSVVLSDFSVGAVTEGRDAQGEASIRLSFDGRTYHGKGVSTDVVEASIRAYLAAINDLEQEQERASENRSSRQTQAEQEHARMVPAAEGA